MTLQRLLPAQEQALASVERGIASQHVTVLRGRPGAGKTLILQTLHQKIGGVLLTSREIIEASIDRHPLSLEETVYSVLKNALDKHDAVIIDDFHFVSL